MAGKTINININPILENAHKLAAMVSKDGTIDEFYTLTEEGEEFSEILLTLIETALEESGFDEVTMTFGYWDDDDE